MAVAKGSHIAPWRWEAYAAIGQDRKRPGLEKEEFLKALSKIKEFGTCEGVKKNRPDLRQNLEQNCQIFDLEAGDVVFATRLLFHKTLAVKPEGRKTCQDKGLESLMRYSVRYVPGTARLVEGFSAEWSIMVNPENSGRSLDEVAKDKKNAGWYPEVWPTLDDNVDEMTRIDETTLANAKEKEKQVYTELRQHMQTS